MTDRLFDAKRSAPSGVEPSAFADAVRALRAGGIILYPTETVYGLGGDARAPSAADRIRRLKGNDSDKPLLVLTDEWARVEDALRPPSPAERALMAHEPPLPLTLVREVRDGAFPGPRGEADALGVRRTTNAVCRALIEALDAPILSTSANLAGRPTPATFEAVDPEIRRGVDALIALDGSLEGVPSTVCRIVDGTLRILRLGAVDERTLRAIVGPD